MRLARPLRRGQINRKPSAIFPRMKVARQDSKKALDGKISNDKLDNDGRDGPAQRLVRRTPLGLRPHSSHDDDIELEPRQGKHPDAAQPPMWPGMGAQVAGSTQHELPP